MHGMYNIMREGLCLKCAVKWCGLLHEKQLASHSVANVVKGRHSSYNKSNYIH